MRTLRMIATMALSVAALVSAQAASAAEPCPPKPQQSTQTMYPAAPQAPSQPPVEVPQSIYQEPVKVAPAPARPTQAPAPVYRDPAPSSPPPAPTKVTSTTQTTQAEYVPPATDFYAERTIEKRPNRALLSTSVGLFGLSYGSSVLGGAISDRNADKRLFIPVVGPWMNLADRGCNRSNPCGEGEGVAKAMIVTSGIAQGASALLALGSLIIPETRTERVKTAGPSVKIVPMSFGAGGGVGAVGSF